MRSWLGVSVTLSDVPHIFPLGWFAGENLSGRGVGEGAGLPMEEASLGFGVALGGVSAEGRRIRGRGCFGTSRL